MKPSAQENQPTQNQTDAPQPLPDEKKLGAAKTSSLEKGGFQLEVPMWKPKPHAGGPRSLLAKYQWGGQGQRTASGVPVGPEGKPNAWRISFPDQPKPDELARIVLFYAFELTEEDKKRLADRLQLRKWLEANTPPQASRETSPRRRPRAHPPAR